MTDSTTCALCEKPRYARGWCVAHYRRFKRYGDPETKRTTGPKPGSGWIENPSYLTVHKRLHKLRGAAKEHLCSCGEPASQWSYTGPRQPGDRMPFSDDLTQYEPLCVPCHKVKDMQAIREEGFHS